MAGAAAAAATAAAVAAATAASSTKVSASAPHLTASSPFPSATTIPTTASSVSQMPWSPEGPMQIGFVGAGRMAEAIAMGMIVSGKVEANNILASAPSDKNLWHFQNLGCKITHSNTEVLQNCSIVFFATKPHILPVVLAEISPAVTRKHVIVSVAAGVSLHTLEKEGAVVMARGRHAEKCETEYLQKLLSVCGLCEEVPEAYINIHTGLSGSGVAYVCMFSEALAEGAIKLGMPSSLAHQIAAQTLLGAAKLLLQSGQHPAQLRSEVCTPGGTTIYGLHALEQGGLRAAAMNAVEAATRRAQELTKQ
ncbi:pyrroline-5-carboxylate reductase 3 isoform X2 [Gracilinanus agilis]|uniref:pyrroline-5-carboxylate reductase 3 isoform X2 n=1 Tax=Gracilinanus agilis TaxID=191870 RepID=UPI001CFE40E4|nr:pyrroline-5-carboxylate reductase 3 isoform X2 [Gracilinanus agilis]